LNDCIAGMVAALFHEAAHAMAAEFFGLRVKAVGLDFSTGFYVRAQRGKPAVNLMVTLAGPFFNLLLAAASLGLMPSFALANLIFGGVNLLPFPHSDGARVTKHIEEMRLT